MTSLNKPVRTNSYEVTFSEVFMMYNEMGKQYFITSQKTQEEAAQAFSEYLKKDVPINRVEEKLVRFCLYSHEGETPYPCWNHSSNFKQGHGVKKAWMFDDSIRTG